jgi:two-component system, sensor histidine kinase and response regulator
MKSTRNVAGQPSETDPAAFLASIVESSDDAIFGLSLTGAIVSWNKAAEEMYGYTAEEIIGQPVLVLSPPDRISEIEQNIAKLKRGERIPHFETKRITKDRRTIDVSVRVSSVRNASGVVAGGAVIARDITAQKRTREIIDTAHRVKNQFLDNMNHEIRTPMNGILGLTELVLETELTTEQRENLGLVKLSTESLLAAVDDILDFTQIDAGKLKLETIPFDFRESLGETMKMLGFRAQKKGLELIYEVAPELPTHLLGDPGRIRRILYNLVGNAIKFTDRGEILITVRQESLSSEGICLHFTVKDTGVGIPPAKHKTVFEPFTQADGSSTRKYGGTGLGLTIAGRLVHLMKGEIWLESEPGKGSTFHFTVQLRVPEASAASPQAPLPISELKGLQVLVVDDSAMNRRVLRGMLERWGMRASDVPNGALALEAMRIARDIGHAFPLVLLDGQMREMDGFMLAERIKADPTLAPATIMMLTSVGHVGDAARCRDLGISAYLVKPVRLSELVDAIRFALQEKTDSHDPTLVTRYTLREAKDRMLLGSR